MGHGSNLGRKLKRHIGKNTYSECVIADAVIAASFPSVTVFSRTLTAKEAGSAQAYAIDRNK
jgi:hypothetical protein